MFEMTKLFPVILMALDLCAAAVYAHYGDVRMVVYWTAAAVITASVTF